MKAGGGEAESCLVYCRENMLDGSSRPEEGVEWLLALRIGPDAEVCCCCCCCCCCAFIRRFLAASSSLGRIWLAGASSACTCSGEADEDPARRSRSSMRLLSFLPGGMSVVRSYSMEGSAILTIIALSDAILYASPLRQVGYLGPILVGIGTSTLSTASAVR